MIRMVSLWSSISLWADRGDDQRDAGDVIAGRDDLKRLWSARDLLNLRKKCFCVAGDNIPCGGSEWPRLTRRLRRGTCREGRSRGRRTAVLVDLEPNHDRQNYGGLVRAQVGPPQGFLSTHPVAKAEVDAVRYSLCLPGRISHSVYHPKCLRLNCFHF
jgi:hypothetical protein